MSPTAKISVVDAINDLSKQDDTILHERSQFLIVEVEKKLEELKSEHGIRGAIRKMGKEKKIQESFVHLGAIRLSTFAVLNPLSLNLPDDFRKTAETTLSSVTYPQNIKDLQEKLRSIFEIKE